MELFLCNLRAFLFCKQSKPAWKNIHCSDFGLFWLCDLCEQAFVCAFVGFVRGFVKRNLFTCANRVVCLRFALFAKKKHAPSVPINLATWGWQASLLILRLLFVILIYFLFGWQEGYVIYIFVCLTFFCYIFRITGLIEIIYYPQIPCLCVELPNQLTEPPYVLCNTFGVNIILQQCNHFKTHYPGLLTTHKGMYDLYAKHIVPELIDIYFTWRVHMFAWLFLW